jgi:protein required for attachment to host cells
MPTTWVLAADSARARLFELAPRGRALREVRDFVHPAGRQRGRELVTDAQGRHFVAGRRDQAPANEPHTTPEQVEEERFARALAAHLERGRTSNRYERLCLLAPPRFLGRLRAALTTEVGKLVSRSVSKDLLALDAAAIKGYLADGLPARERTWRRPHPAGSHAPRRARFRS